MSKRLRRLVEVLLAGVALWLGLLLILPSGGGGAVEEPRAPGREPPPRVTNAETASPLVNEAVLQRLFIPEQPRRPAAVPQQAPAPAAAPAQAPWISYVGSVTTEAGLVRYILKDTRTNRVFVVPSGEQGQPAWKILADEADRLVVESEGGQYIVMKGKR